MLRAKTLYYPLVTDYTGELRRFDDPESFVNALTAGCPQVEHDENLGYRIAYENTHSRWCDSELEAWHDAAAQIDDENDNLICDTYGSALEGFKEASAICNIHTEWEQVAFFANRLALLTKKQ